ncbi:CueP family metal-binding protein [Georgenia sp. EYE_87]|uniref:CueP family metal-binding protein n=1 Tax=Georgenia sp. EYE_87 TaxID=2853448 RepID=UPI002003BF12|nr:CueP family metal-binding protein [Georgenia sp. EYE_87]MCK6211694.1 CueP family metal-binding protein [Georgenia sp. EYE_87]
MMRRIAVAAAGVVLVLAGCSTGAEPGTDETAEAGQTAAAGTTEAASAGVEVRLADYGLDGLAADRIVDELDRLPLGERPDDLMASVRVDELVLSDGQEELAMELPQDRFYVSVAPFVEQTHECFYHSLTTCTGELGGEEVRVTIVDDAGEVLVDEQTTTYDNGFVGFWLPREVAGTIRVSYDGLEGEADFATTDDGATCVTTLQLA